MAMNLTDCGRLLLGLASGSKCLESEPWTSAKLITGRSGLYSLKNHDVDHEVNEMFDMGAETMELPQDEKMKFEQGDRGMSFG